MACSLEARVPYLDHRIVEFANSLPTSWKFNKVTKRILKDAVRTVIPESTLNKPKRGFAVPLDEWFRGELQSFLKDNLFTSGFDYMSFGLNKDAVEKMFSDHIQCKRDYSTILYQMLLFIYWARMN